MKCKLSLLIISILIVLMIIPAVAADLLSSEECVEHVVAESETEYPKCGIPGMTAGTYCKLCEKTLAAER